MTAITAYSQWESPSAPGVPITSANVGDTVCFVCYSSTVDSSSLSDWEAIVWAPDTTGVVATGWFVTGNDASTPESDPVPGGPTGETVPLPPSTASEVYIGFICTVIRPSIYQRYVFVSFNATGADSPAGLDTYDEIVVYGWGLGEAPFYPYGGNSGTYYHWLGEPLFIGIQAAGGSSSDANVTATNYPNDWQFLPGVFFGSSDSVFISKDPDSGPPSPITLLESGTYNYGSIAYPPETPLIIMAGTFAEATSEDLVLTFTADSQSDLVFTFDPALLDQRMPIFSDISYFVWDGSNWNESAAVAVGDDVAIVFRNGHYLDCDMEVLQLPSGAVFDIDTVTYGAWNQSTDWWDLSTPWPGWSGVGSTINVPASNPFGNEWQVIVIKGSFTATGTYPFLFRTTGDYCRAWDPVIDVPVGDGVTRDTSYPTEYSGWFESDGVTPTSTAFTGDTCILKVGVSAPGADIEALVNSISSGVTVNSATAERQHLNGTRQTLTWSGFAGVGDTYDFGVLGQTWGDDPNTEIYIKYNVTFTSAGTKSISTSFKEVSADSAFIDTALAPSITVNTPTFPPTAVITATNTATVNTPKSFSGSASSDPDGTIVSYSWDFGDSGTDTGVSPTHTYTSIGTYTVTLTVTDNDGLTDTDTLVVTVAGIVPDAVITAPSTAFRSESVAFNSNSSTGTITTYSWDFGDSGTSTTPNPTHAYGTVGSYTVTLTLTGPAGSDTGTHGINVVSDQPIAVIEGPFSGSIGLPIGFTSSASSDPNGTIVSRLWDFGDSGTSTAVSPSHTYTATGTYTVALTVTDNNGNTGSTSRSVVISEFGGGEVAEGERIPWALYNPLSGQSYNLEINPQTFKIGGKRKAITTEKTTAGQHIFFEGREAPVSFSFGGVTLTEGQLTTLTTLAEVRSQILVEDDLGHQYWFYITTLNLTRQLKRQSPWFHNYTVDATLLDWN